MRRIVAFLALAVASLVSLSMLVSASTVIVSGSGPTVDAALRDCMRTAVEQAVGVYVDSKTLVEKNTVSMQIRADLCATIRLLVQQKLIAVMI